MQGSSAQQSHRAAAAFATLADAAAALAVNDGAAADAVGSEELRGAAAASEQPSATAALDELAVLLPYHNPDSDMLQIPGAQQVRTLPEEKAARLLAPGGGAAVLAVQQRRGVRLSLDARGEPAILWVRGRAAANVSSAITDLQALVYGTQASDQVCCSAEQQCGHKCIPCAAEPRRR